MQKRELDFSSSLFFSLFRKGRLSPPRLRKSSSPPVDFPADCLDEISENPVFMRLSGLVLL